MIYYRIFYIIYHPISSVCFSMQKFLIFYNKVINHEVSNDRVTIVLHKYKALS